MNVSAMFKKLFGFKNLESEEWLYSTQQLLGKDITKFEPVNGLEGYWRRKK